MPLGLWNARSICNKSDFVQSLIFGFFLKLFCITETWLTESVSINELYFIVYRRDRGSRGGGVLVAISRDLPSKLYFVSSHIEFIAIQIFSHPSILLCCLYLPPGSLQDSDFCLILNSVLRSLPVDQEIILLGDFNLPGVNWSSYTGILSSDSNFCDLLVDMNLLQLVEEPTHKNGGVLDLILTNSARIYNISVDSQVCALHSDHYLITCDNCTSSCTTNRPKGVYKYSSDILFHLQDHMLDLDFNSVFGIQDPDLSWSIVKS